VFRIRIHLNGAGSSFFKLNTDPDPGFRGPKIRVVDLKFVSDPTPDSDPTFKEVSAPTPDQDPDPALDPATLFLYFVSSLCNFCSWIRIRIPNTDPDPLT
jgi:hypothetical protein